MPSEKTITAYANLMKTLRTGDKSKVAALHNLGKHFGQLSKSPGLGEFTRAHMSNFSKSIDTLLNMKAPKEERLKALDTMENLKPFLEGEPADPQTGFRSNYAYIMNRTKGAHDQNMPGFENWRQDHLRYELDSVSESMQLGFTTKALEQGPVVETPPNPFQAELDRKQSFQEMVENFTVELHKRGLDGDLPQNTNASKPNTDTYSAYKLELQNKLKEGDGKLSKQEARDIFQQIMTLDIHANVTQMGQTKALMPVEGKVNKDFVKETASSMFNSRAFDMTCGDMKPSELFKQSFYTNGFMAKYNQARKILDKNISQPTYQDVIDNHTSLIASGNTTPRQKSMLLAELGALRHITKRGNIQLNKTANLTLIRYHSNAVIKDDSAMRATQDFTQEQFNWYAKHPDDLNTLLVQTQKTMEQEKAQAEQKRQEEIRLANQKQNQRAEPKKEEPKKEEPKKEEPKKVNRNDALNKLKNERAQLENQPVMKSEWEITGQSKKDFQDTMKTLNEKLNGPKCKKPWYHGFNDSPEYRKAKDAVRQLATCSSDELTEEKLKSCTETIRAYFREDDGKNSKLPYRKTGEGRERADAFIGALRETMPEKEFKEFAEKVNQSRDKEHAISIEGSSARRRETNQRAEIATKIENLNKKIETAEKKQNEPVTQKAVL